ncbi:MAG: hypothetical protein ACYC6C_12570, partial [Coriobacteriia bacterium]
MTGRYHNTFADGSVYARAINLIKGSMGAGAGEKLVLLDLACGAGAIAAASFEQLGMHYVGIDADSTFKDVVESQGGEFAMANLDARAEEVLVAVRSVLSGRRVGAVVMLDGLEHMAKHSEILRVIQVIAHENDAPVILSVPNVAHRDV